MSLILEALKKSEAERRLGQLPGLLDSAQPLRPRRSRRGGRLAVIAALLLIAAGAAFWGGQQFADAERQSADAASGVQATAEGAPAPEAAEARATPAQTRAEDAPSAMEADADRSTADPVTPAPRVDNTVSRLPQDPGFASVERESLPQQAVPLPAPAPAPRPEASAHAPSPPASAAAAPVAAPSAVPAHAPNRVDPPAARALPPPLATLGHERRGQLPPLKVSMHVYTEDPATRVVIIDGRRLREGDPIDGALRLREILREGSVLELDGQAYLLPRP